MCIRDRTRTVVMVSGPTALRVSACGGLVVPMVRRPNVRLLEETPRPAKAEMPRMRRFSWSATRKLPEASSKIPMG